MIEKGTQIVPTMYSQKRVTRGAMEWWYVERASETKSTVQIHEESPQYNYQKERERESTWCI